MCSHLSTESTDKLHNNTQQKPLRVWFALSEEFCSSHQLAPRFSLAVDVGCGTGISTRPLVEYFDHVIGCDVSESQIEMAKQQTSDNKVKYT